MFAIHENMCLNWKSVKRETYMVTNGPFLGRLDTKKLTRRLPASEKNRASSLLPPTSTPKLNALSQKSAFWYYNLEFQISIAKKKIWKHYQTNVHTNDCIRTNATPKRMIVIYHERRRFQRRKFGRFCSLERSKVHRKHEIKMMIPKKSHPSERWFSGAPLAKKHVLRRRSSLDLRCKECSKVVDSWKKHYLLTVTEKLINTTKPHVPISSLDCKPPIPTQITQMDTCNCWRQR